MIGLFFRLLILVSICLVIGGNLCQAQAWRELIVQADSLSKHRQGEAAIVTAQMAVDSARSHCGGADTSVAISLTTLGDCFYRQNDFERAEYAYSEALGILESFLGHEDDDVAVAYRNTGNAYLNLSRFPEAELAYETALTIQERLLGSVHLEVSMTLTNLGALEWMMGNYDESEHMTKRAMTIDSTLLGASHPHVAFALNNLAALYHDMGRYEEAETYQRTALQIDQGQAEPDHRGIATDLTNLGAICDARGKFAEAESLYEMGLDLRENTLSRDHPDVAYSLYGLAVLFLEQAKFAEAEPLLQRAATIWENAHGHDSPEVANAVGTLGLLCSSQARYTEAEVHCQEALVIRKKALGEDHPDVAFSLVELGTVLAELRQFHEAESLLTKSIEIRATSLGDSSAEVGNSYFNLAGLLIQLEQYEGAEAALQRSIANYEKVFGPDHTLVGSCLTRLGQVQTLKNDYAQAILSLERAFAIQQGVFRVAHPEIAETASSLATVLTRTGNQNDALQMGNLAYRIRRENFRDGAGVLSENNALLYSVQMRDEAFRYLSLLIGDPARPTRHATEIAQLVFSTKGQVNDGIVARHRAAMQDTDGKAHTLASSLRKAREHLSNLYVRGRDDDHPETYRTELEVAAKEKSRLESEFAQASMDFRRQIELWDVTPESLQTRLPDNSVLVEFMRFDFEDESRKRSPHYLAVILSKSGSPVIVELGQASRIDTAIAWYRSLVQAPRFAGEDDFRKISTRLYEFVWKPIEQYINSQGTVFIACDGQLSLLSFAGLLDNEGVYLIERHPLHYLASGRDLVRLQDSDSLGMNLLALGDPEFDAVFAERTAGGNDTILLTASDTVAHTRRLSPECISFRDQIVDRLPGSRVEIEHITKIWQQIDGAAAITRLGAQASEENFKRECIGNRVIHIATHGFSRSEYCAIGTLHRRLDNSSTYLGYNPLLMSGLFLAGANTSESDISIPGKEDGILTAEEVSTLNLKGTSLVVLSGCETGLGRVESGEGMSGLQRAFQLAGARTVISTLWSISDATTSEIMSQLYRDLDVSVPEFMQRLALEQIRASREAGDLGTPTEWAAFVASGDWVIR